MLVKDDDVIWPLRILCYIFPLRFCTQSMAYGEFIDSTFDGTERCNPINDLGCEPGGYMCTTRACFGKTGAEVLESLNVHFGLITSADKTMENIVNLLIFGVSVKVLYILRIMLIVNNH